MPPAIITPPAIAARIGSLTTLVLGSTLRNQVVDATDRMLRKMYRLPTTIRPQIRMGRFMPK
ncbi:hypothetical protein D3C87_2173080 [compost metagenome]